MNFSLPPGTPKGQRDAVLADNKTITVGAGAGTGKTWVLSGRYVRLLLDSGELSPSDILTLTYTEAAAGDMKQRIEDRLRSELDALDDTERKRAVINGLSDTWISTIHSFAARLIRESGLTLDIDPMASVITTRQEEDFWESIKNATEFANLRELARAYGDKTLREAAEFLDADEYFGAAVSKWRAGVMSNFAKYTAELHASSGHTWREMLSWAENDELLIETAKPKVQSILADEWRQVWDVWENISLPRAKNPYGAGARLNELLQWQVLNSPENPEALQHFYTRIMTDRDITGRGEPFTTLKDDYLGMTLSEWRKTRPKIIADITQKFDAPITEQEKRMRSVLMKFCALCWGMWDTMKTRRGLLSFSDMITHARAAIAKGDVRRKFAHILVDEFQDTDPIQFAMIEALKGEDSGLFAVGDYKQSIYKFRHADPSLFAQTIKNSENIELDTSFRTREKLLALINKIFSRLWRDGLGRSEVMNNLHYKEIRAAEIDSERNSDAITMPVFEVILAKHNRNSTPNARKVLAENLAQKIYTWVSEGRTVWDKAQKIIRPVKYSDFAILSRSRSIYPVLEEALEKFGIKSIQDRSTDFFGRGEVGDVVCMLRAAADFENNFAVAGWLMSPFSGVSEDDAITKCLTLADEKHKPIDLIRENFPEAYSRLEYLALVGEVEGPAGIIEVYDKNRSWLSCYRENDRLRALRNVRLALSIARDFQGGGTSTLTACAEWLMRAVRNQVSYEEPAWHDEGENAVKLGVVHSAKGLEYPVTVIFESRTQKNSERNALRPSREMGLVFANLPDDVEADITPKLSEWEKLLSERGDMEEEERLFYVAATRAQDSLIFCGLVDEATGDPHPNTWTKFLLDSVSPDEVKPEYVDDVEAQPVIFTEEAKPLQPVSIIHTKNSLRQISASSFSLFEWCPFAWRRSYRQGLTLSWENPNDDYSDDDFAGGAELGSLAHWILSRWPKNENYESELDTLLFDRATRGKLPGYLRPAWSNREGKNSLREWLMKFAGSELGRKLMGIPNVQREKSFRLRLNDSTILAGAIDALYGNSIIDYKITRINDAPPGLYESQLEFYALAVHELTGADEVNTCIAFLREGQFVGNAYSDFSGIRERVIHAAECCASGSYEANVKNCALCPFKKGCVNNAGKN